MSEVRGVLVWDNVRCFVKWIIAGTVDTSLWRTRVLFVESACALIVMLGLSSCNKGGEEAGGSPKAAAELGFSTPQEAADTFVQALLENDWNVYWRRFPEESVIDSWTGPYTNVAMQLTQALDPSAKLPRTRAESFREDFNECASKIVGKSPKLTKVKGGTADERQKEKGAHRKYILCDDLNIYLQVDGMEKRVWINFDNPVMVDGKLFPMFISTCR